MSNREGLTHRNGLPKNIKLRVEHHGQPYVDEPRFNYLRPTALVQALRKAADQAPLPPIQIFVGIERIRLSWES